MPENSENHQIITNLPWKCLKVWVAEMEEVLHILQDILERLRRCHPENKKFIEDVEVDCNWAIGQLLPQL